MAGGGSMASFSALLGIRKPEPGVVQVVEAAGLLLRVRRTSEDDQVDAAAYRGVPSSSIYGATLRALARRSFESLEQLRSLNIATVDDETAHEVFAKTLQASFATVGTKAGSGSSPNLLAPRWASAVSANSGDDFANQLSHAAPDGGGRNYFADNLETSSDDTGGLNQRSASVPWTSLSSTGGAEPADNSMTSASALAAINNTASTQAKSATSTMTSKRGGGSGGGGGRGGGENGNGNGVMAGVATGDATVLALKVAVLEVTQRLAADHDHLPLRNQPMAVLVDGSRMSLLALELAGAAWKFGRFVVVHVSGVTSEDVRDDIEEIANNNNHNDNNSSRATQGEQQQQRGAERGGDGRQRETSSGVNPTPVHSVEDFQQRGVEEADGDRKEGGGEGWCQPEFLREELREICLRQLEIPEESLELVFRTLPPGGTSPFSSGSERDVTDILDAVLAERRVEVVFMGCYGRRGPRVAQFGRVAQWALEETPYQVVFAKKFSPSMISSAFLARPKRYLVAVTADLAKVSSMLDRLLPLVSPRDTVVLIHILDESVEDVISGDTVDEENIRSDLASLLSNKRGLSHRVRVEKTGRPPEHPTQTVVQRIVKAAEEEAADFLAILHDEVRGSYRTVTNGCLREARCSLIAIH